MFLHCVFPHLLNRVISSVQKLFLFVNAKKVFRLLEISLSLVHGWLLNEKYDLLFAFTLQFESYAKVSRFIRA